MVLEVLALTQVVLDKEPLNGGCFRLPVSIII